MYLSKKLLMTSAICAVALAAQSPAFAQSTGTQEVEKVEKVVVTGERQGTGGTIVKEKRPKTRSTVTQDYIGTQPGGQTIFQSLNLAPGVNFTNSDPYGSSGGNVRIRGFDGNRVSLTVDGVPLNDTGNYAIFTNQMVDPEYLSRATVNTGTTDVDSPTASATGGTINLVTRKPYDELTLTAVGSVGSFNYQRLLGIIDLGEYRGVSAFGGVSFQEYEKFKGPGELQKTQGNARIYQKIGEDSFISVIGHYNENRNNFYRNLTLAQIAAFGDSFDNLATCTRATFVNGSAQSDGASPFPAIPGGAATDNILNPSSCTNFYNLRINPSNTGNVRIQSNFRLTDNIRLTVDPSWQYVKANGGGTNTFSETDRRLAPAGGGTGVDLSGDGDLLDTVRLYTPNNTNTSRYGITASLIYEFDDSSNFRIAYTGDHGRHRQTAAVGRIYADGNPVDIFGGLDSTPAKVFGLDGSFLRGRDRLSHAILNQVSASYTGRFFDDRLLVDVGVRAPFFSRDLNQYCFTQLGTGTVRCTTEPFTDADGDGIGTLAGVGPVGGFPVNFARPFQTQFKYDAVLPNIGVSYELFENNIIYASYAEGLSAPRTDNLYVAQCASCPPTPAGAASQQETVGVDQVVFPGVQPEKSKAYDLGYRFQGETVTASIAFWYNQFENRIVTSFDAATGQNVDRNVGRVDLKGVDAEIGWKATPDLTLYASASYNESELKDPFVVGVLVVPAGNTLVETPDWTAAGRIQYKVASFLSLGFQGKYVGDRFSNDVNTEIAPSYTVFDANAVFDLEEFGLGNTLLQVNATNIFDEHYLGSISSVTSGAASFSVGAPQTFQAQIKTKF